MPASALASSTPTISCALKTPETAAENRESHVAEQPKNDCCDDGYGGAVCTIA